MTLDEAQKFGKKLEAARLARRMSRPEVVREVRKLHPDLDMSDTVLKRLESGGTYPYERKDPNAVDRVNTAWQQQMRRVYGAYLLGMSEVPATAPVAAKTEAAAPKRGPVSSEKKAKTSDKTSDTASATKTITVKTPKHVTGKYAGKFRLVRTDRTLFTQHGVSGTVIADTLATLRAVGIPTREAKATIVKKFSEYVESLDK